MGGRGSGSGLSKVRIGFSSVTPPITPPQPQPVKPKTSSVVEQGMYKRFMQATDDEKAQMITTLTREKVPIFLADNDFQKLTFALGGTDKPTIVTDKQLNSINGVEIYRTVNSVKDTKHGITYNADDIATQIQKGTVTRVSDSGGSAYGRGIYFADDYGSSACYGNVNGNVKKCAVVRAKIDPKAKVIDYNKATRQMQREMASGSKLGKALSKCDSQSRVSIYALSKGYSAISSGGWGGYYNVLSRKALVMSEDVRPRSSRW